MKSLILLLTLSFILGACGTKGDSTPSRDQADKPPGPGAGGIGPSQAGAGPGVGIEPDAKRFVIEVPEVYEASTLYAIPGQRCSTFSCLVTQLGSNAAWLGGFSSSYDRTVDIERRRHVFASGLDLRCEQKFYRAAGLIEAVCEFVFTPSEAEYPHLITRGTGPLSQMIQAKLGWGATVEKIAAVNPLIQTPLETDVEVRLESGRIAKVSRLKLSCPRDRGPDETYTSCTFTGAITGTKSKFE